MRCVWDLGSANAQQVTEHAKQRYDTDLVPSTVGIYLYRMMQKDYLRSTPGLVGRGRPAHVYIPIVTWEDAFRLQVQRFIEDYKADPETLQKILKESFPSEPEESVKPQAPRRRAVR
jgi:predicted transcriptional regulator